jgi:hypothetical protein
MYAYQLIEMLSNVDPNTEVCVRVDGASGSLAKTINSWDYAYVRADETNCYRDTIVKDVDVEDLDGYTRQVVILY